MQNIISVAVVGILLDVLTGFTKAFFEKKIKSSVMREGGKHKVSELILIVFSFYLSKGLTLLKISMPFNPVTLVCTYITIMECISILENIKNMNSNCIPDKLNNFFKKIKGDI